MRPYLARVAHEIAAHYLGDPSLAVIAGGQQARKLMKLVRSTQVIDEGMRVDSLTRRGHALGDAILMLLAQDLRVAPQIVDGRRSTVRADTDVVFAADLERMLEMGNHVRGRGMTGRVEKGHEIDTHESAIVLTGASEHAAFRINLAQAFNGLGAVIAPIIGGAFILSPRRRRVNKAKSARPYW